MSYKFYKVFFKRRQDPTESWGPHVALFVQNGRHPVLIEGTMFHVVEDHERTNREVVNLKVDARQGILEECKTYSGAVHIGTITEGSMKSLVRICKNMGRVIAPQGTKTPSCTTWVDNVIHDLHKYGIVSFAPGYPIPERKPLRIPIPSSSSSDEASGSSSKDKGSPSSSKDKVSPSSSKYKGSPWSGKDKGSPSSSKDKGSSSSSKEKGPSSSTKHKGYPSSSASKDKGSSSSTKHKGYPSSSYSKDKGSSSATKHKVYPSSSYSKDKGASSSHKEDDSSSSSFL